MIWVAMLIPFDVIVVPAHILWALALGAFAMLFAGGWRSGLLQAGTANRARWLLGFALVIPFVGALAYLPNPWYANFYTLPYLIGSALLTGMGATWLQSRSLVGHMFAIAAWIGILAHSATTASNHAARTDAAQRRDEWVVAFVADSVVADSVQFATRTRPPYDWLGFGAAMARISRAKGNPWPLTHNVSCDDARKALASGFLTVNLESSCKFGTRVTKVIAQHYRRLDLRQFRIVLDSAHADLVVPVRGNGTP